MMKYEILIKIKRPSLIINKAIIVTKTIKSSYSLFSLKSWSNDYPHKLSSRNSPPFLDCGTYKKNIQVVPFGTQILLGPWVLAMVPFGTQTHFTP